jgi:hypothetical protein
MGYITREFVAHRFKQTYRTFLKYIVEIFIPEFVFRCSARQSQVANIMWYVKLGILIHTDFMKSLIRQLIFKT